MVVAAFIAGCVFPFIMPARMAITASVVGPARIQSAMAFAGGVMNLSRVAGPAVMGVVIARYSITAAYGLASVLYMIAIACMFRIKTSHSSVPGTEKKKLLADIAQGISYVRSNRPLLMCILFGLLPMLVAMPFQNLLVMLAEQAWQRGEGGVGTLIAMGGVGGVLGSMWVLRRGDTPHRLKFMVVTNLGFALFLGVFSQMRTFYPALLPLLVANVCASAAQTVNNSMVQILVDDEVRGRVSSLMMMSFGLMPVGVFPMAVAADHYGAANAIGGACAILFAMITLFFVISPSLRNLDNTVSTKLEDASPG
jgi:predicted MFS family arabinose efflux permease